MKEKEESDLILSGFWLALLWLAQFFVDIFRIFSDLLKLFKYLKCFLLTF